MEIILNNLPKQVPDTSSILQVIHEFISDQPTAMAVAVNQQVIPKSSWHSHQLMPSDRLTIIVPTQGG
ncbi:sulfur carrier protein ThiS [Dyadobacter tibetensis]|uniref:sulfur carrier protein ThiS n=1 Tax=Dyadobacter tibetensis TaxID=1211851 RepID=UPI00046F86BE|nr:sulfur carrier protein ThiS [Dyadobacter tibetensis]